MEWIDAYGGHVFRVALEEAFALAAGSDTLEYRDARRGHRNAEPA